MLRLEAEAVVLFESTSAGAAVEEITAIKLHAGLGRIDLHHAAAPRLFHAGGQLQLSLLAAQDKAMVIALRLMRIFFELADPLANRMRRGEIEWRSFDRRQLARRNR